MSTMTSPAPTPLSDRTVQFHECTGLLSNGDLIGLGDGAMAALAKAKSGADVQLLSVNADIIRPIAQAGRLEIVTEITRASRTVIFVSAQIKQGDQAMMTLTALYKTAASK
jgi:acyl-coenzyme A thioesterase PaaI-like protein